MHNVLAPLLHLSMFQQTKGTILVNLIGSRGRSDVIAIESTVGGSEAQPYVPRKNLLSC